MNFKNRNCGSDWLRGSCAPVEGESAAKRESVSGSASSRRSSALNPASGASSSAATALRQTSSRRNPGVGAAPMSDSAESPSHRCASSWASVNIHAALVVSEPLTKTSDTSGSDRANGGSARNKWPTGTCTARANASTCFSVGCVTPSSHSCNFLNLVASFYRATPKRSRAQRSNSGFEAIRVMQPSRALSLRHEGVVRRK